MKESAVSFALRRLREDITRPKSQIILAAVILVLGLSGPFGTIEVMRFGPRLAYWAFVALSTYCMGSFISGLFYRTLHRDNVPRWVAPFAIALVTGIVVSLFILGLNMVVFENPPDTRAYIGGVIRNVMIVSCVIALAMYFLVMIPREKAAEAAPPPPPLLDRLELDKRGPLIAISVQDHYVEVVTTKGTSLILMRLGDAIRETGDTPGLQVHRSHWVATEHVVRAESEGGRATLTLTGERTVPVSRTFLPAVREAGLLPLSGKRATKAD